MRRPPHGSFGDQSLGISRASSEQWRISAELVDLQIENLEAGCCRRKRRAPLSGKWGPEVPASAGDLTPPDFEAQCEAMLDAGPKIISSIMGLYPLAFVARMKASGILWFANVTTVAEAKAAQAAGADAVVAQGMEAGGHRGAFDAAQAEVRMVGLFSLLPAVVDAVKIPVIASGGIGDARGVAAAIMLGASAAQIGTCFLRSPEARLPTAWADGIGKALPEDTIVTRAFSGRAGRSLATPRLGGCRSRRATAGTLPRSARPYSGHARCCCKSQ